MIKIKKIVKPIEIDAHFKYRCPKCGNEHWASLNEARTKGFKIVCDCKKVFSPKRIKKIQIAYCSTVKASPKTLDRVAEPEQKIKPKSISDELLGKCSKILIGYGFTKEECQDMLNKAYQIDQSEDCGQLVKLALKSLGVDKNE